MRHQSEIHGEHDLFLRRLVGSQDGGQPPAVGCQPATFQLPFAASPIYCEVAPQALLALGLPDGFFVDGLDDPHDVFFVAPAERERVFSVRIRNAFSPESQIVGLVLHATLGPCFIHGDSGRFYPAKRNGDEIIVADTAADAGPDAAAGGSAYVTDWDWILDPVANTCYVPHTDARGGNSLQKTEHDVRLVRRLRPNGTVVARGMRLVSNISNGVCIMVDDTDGSAHVQSLTHGTRRPFAQEEDVDVSTENAVSVRFGQQGHLVAFRHDGSIVVYDPVVAEAGPFTAASRRLAAYTRALQDSGRPDLHLPWGLQARALHMLTGDAANDSELSRRPRLLAHCRVGFTGAGVTPGGVVFAAYEDREVFWVHLCSETGPHGLPMDWTDVRPRPGIAADSGVPLRYDDAS